MFVRFGYCLGFGLSLAGALACTTGPAGTAGETVETGSETTDATTGPGGSTTGTTSTGAVDPTTGSEPGTSSGSSSSEPGGSSSGGSSGPAPETEGAAPSFTEVYETVLVPYGCTAGYCHGDSAGGLTLTDEATSYASLVEVEATAVGCETTRVVPGAPDQSALWQRVRPAALDGGQACGDKMPKNSMGLPDADAALVRAWIEGGALE